MFVKVPDMIRKSPCRGVGRKIIPNRSKSYRLTVACIISTAQHAKPNVNGHKEPNRIHVKIVFIGVLKNENYIVKKLQKVVVPEGNLSVALLITVLVLLFQDG